MGSQKKEAILQTKWAVNFVKKAKWAKNDYMAASEDVPTDINPVAWWKSHAMELLVLLVQPSSAAAEIVFSILQRFTAQQQSSLEDYLNLSVML